MKWDAYGFVVASRYRQMIVRCLFQHPKTPAQLSIQVNLATAHVSRVLRELCREDLAKCLNPNRAKGRVYELTDTGKTIAEVLETDSRNKT